MTGAVIVMVLVGFTYANSVMQHKVAEIDFISATKFMQTVGLQVDDVAWSMGQRQTAWYSSTYGEVTILSSALNYTVEVKTKGSGSYQFLNSYKVGVLLFNVPISSYSKFNGYYELIFPSITSDLVANGTSAPVVKVFATEKVPMGDGNFIRVVGAPSMRLVDSVVETSDKSTLYCKLYLPILKSGASPRLSQSVTLTGGPIFLTTANCITGIKVTVSFPTETSYLGFDASFFHFPSLSQTIQISSGNYDDCVLEFYAGEVEVAFGIRS